MNRHSGFPPTQAFEASVFHHREQKKSREIPRHHPPMPPPARLNVDDFNFAYSFECRRHLRAWKAHEDQNSPYRQNLMISAPNAYGSHQDSPGDYNRQISIYWKTKLCYRWQSSGQCPYGDQCSYAHGIAELRKPREDHRELNIKNAAAVPPKVDPSLAIDVLANTKTEMSSLPGAHPKIRALTLEKSKRIYGDWIDDF